MKRMRALNESDSEQESGDTENNGKLTREAQEERVLAAYNEALLLVSNEEYRQSINALENILEEPYLNDESCEMSPLQNQIKFACHENLGKLYMKEECLDIAASCDAYLMASHLRPEKGNLWYHLGLGYQKLLKLYSAYEAFFNGLKCSNAHWGCISHLINITYFLNDFTGCLYFCAHGLSLNPGFTRGLIMRDHLFELHPYLKDVMKTGLTNPHSLMSTSSYSGIQKENTLKELREMKSRYRESIIKEGHDSQESIPEAFEFRPSLTKYTWVELFEDISHLCEFMRGRQILLSPVKIMVDENDSAENTQSECSFSQLEERSMDTISCVDTELSAGALEGKQQDALVSECEGVEEKENAQKNNLDCEAAGNDTPVSSQSSEQSRKKTKRDVKWWQLEGKRRSERVRGQAQTVPSSNSFTGESTFEEDLKEILPSFCSQNGLEETVGTACPTLPMTGSAETTLSGDNGLSLSVSDLPGERQAVKQFLSRCNEGDAIDIVTSLMTEFVSKMSCYTWSPKLRALYLHLYEFYSEFIPCYEVGQETDKATLQDDALVRLTAVELKIEEETSVSNVAWSTACISDRKEWTLTYVKDICDVLEPSISTPIQVRRLWALIKLLCYKNEDIDDIFSVIKELEAMLSQESCDNKEYRNPCGQNSIISLKYLEEQKKQIKRKAGLHRVEALLKEKNYEELIEVLSYCLSEVKEKSNWSLERWTMFLEYHQILLQSYYNCGDYISALKQFVQTINHAFLCKDVPKPDQVLALKVCISTLRDIFNNGDRNREPLGSLDVPVTLIPKLVDTLVKLLVYFQDNSTFNWVLEALWVSLHKTLVQWERKNEVNSEFNAPSSVLLLKLAHEHLGKSEKCSFGDGCLLKYSLCCLISSKDSLYDDFEETTTCIEQAVFCLYGLPNKKAKGKSHLKVHNAQQLSLDWEMAKMLFQHFKPRVLPEFDSVLNSSISSDSLSVLMKVKSTVPGDMLPQSRYNAVANYLNEGEKLDVHSIPLDFPPEMNTLWYLLGDYFFKNKEWKKAIGEYTWDVACVPDRFDSWAAMGLARAELVNDQLTYNEATHLQITNDADSAVACFKQALRLQPDNTKIRIEFGSFVYAMHSYCSRLSKTEKKLSEDPKFNKKVDGYLNMATMCFEPHVKKIEGDEHEEDQDDWLHHYMVGKIQEKFKPKNFECYLTCYENAAKVLHKLGAPYPSKINFNTPPEYSLEALEMHYRLHASILSYIEKNEYDEDADRKLQLFVERAACSPFIIAVSESKRKSTNEDKKIMSCVQIMVSSMISKIEEAEGGVEAPRLFITEEEDIILERSPATTCSAKTPVGTPIDEQGNSGVMGELSSFGLLAFKEKMLADERREAQIAQERLQEVQEPCSDASITDDEISTLVEAKRKEIILSLSQEKLFLEKLSKTSYGRVIAYCIVALRVCVLRFPQHHKALVRLAKTYRTHMKDPKYAQKLLTESFHLQLDKDVFTKKKVQGLFSERKPQNMFHSVYRNPCNDFDRPGSFSNHMSKAIKELWEVLKRNGEFALLADLVLSLSKTPDNDKRYLFECDRLKLVESGYNFMEPTMRLALKQCEDEKSLDVFEEMQEAILKLNRVGLSLKSLVSSQMPYNVLFMARNKPRFDNLATFFELHVRNGNWSQGLFGFTNFLRWAKGLPSRLFVKPYNFTEIENELRRSNDLKSIHDIIRSPSKVTTKLAVGSDLVTISASTSIINKSSSQIGKPEQTFRKDKVEKIPTMELMQLLEDTWTLDHVRQKELTIHPVSCFQSTYRYGRNAKIVEFGDPTPIKATKARASTPPRAHERPCNANRNEGEEEALDLCTGTRRPSTYDSMNVNYFLSDSHHSVAEKLDEERKIGERKRNNSDNIKEEASKYPLPPKKKKLLSNEGNLVEDQPKDND